MHKCKCNIIIFYSQGYWHQKVWKELI